MFEAIKNIFKSKAEEEKEMSMFCYQCEQTAGGKGCSKVGVCGKNPRVAALQDLLIHQLKGIALYGEKLIEKNIKIEDEVHEFMMDGLFSTLTNVNFDEERFVKYINKSEEIKRALENKVGAMVGNDIAMYISPKTVDDMVNEGMKHGIMNDGSPDEDIRSLRELIVYGLKGIAAYSHQANILGKSDERVNNFFYKALAGITKLENGIGELFDLAMELGQVNLIVMELLSNTNRGFYGVPEPTEVLITKKKGPFIIVSGHDLTDLKQLLEQTEGKGINIYTHGEMLPCHAYPELKKHKHLVGNYGGAWQDQQKEFDSIPGCVVMTTNCIQKPRENYSDRIFTTSVVGWPNVAHIEETNGVKDFTSVIEKALALGGWNEDEAEKKILVGFGHEATLNHADAIINAVKSGAIKHFFLVGGCDGAKPGRNYYTDFAEKAPNDTVILTLACGKYRFNKLDLGTVAGLPRLLDVGQCNDAYSAIKIALALAEAFECGVNDLPLSMILSWYEQKAVCILLTLLSIGIKNIKLGPSLPAFVSPNVLNVLIEKFNIAPISTVEEDLKAALGE